jgi:hypothetical protein
MAGMGKAYKPAINLSISFQKKSEKKFTALNRLGRLATCCPETDRVALADRIDELIRPA